MNNENQLPVLYSFRRCPYAMRARLGLVMGEVAVEIREILLRDKPKEMLAISPKATVPVLQLNNGKVLQESLDIMFWALTKSPATVKAQQLMDTNYLTQANRLIKENDEQFKINLDRYKYSIRYPEKTAQQYRQDCEVFLAKLEHRLAQHAFLCGDKMSVADIGIFPFIRQFAGVDRRWFDSSPYIYLQNWLKRWLESDEFICVMKKYPLWKENRPNETLFPEWVLD